MICRKPRLSNRQKYRHRWGCYFFDKDRRCMCTYGDAVFPSSRFFQRRFSWDGGRAEDRLRISPDFSHISRYSARVRSRSSKLIARQRCLVTKNSNAIARRNVIAIVLNLRGPSQLAINPLMRKVKLKIKVARRSRMLG